ncbi:MAG: hypothetical protein BWY74_02312 [Firmicutes bacterium ADurb.Bin419]|nr:MAG: hypothetical protein BWY74_02312 [Firmicutes bacterium ADurb.Bin419]
MNRVPAEAARSIRSAAVNKMLFRLKEFGYERMYMQ